MNGYHIYQGDALETLRTMPDQSVHCCVTSPPYWGLRDYGVSGQLGLEASPEEYIDRMVQVFREVRRVLRDDGTLWLNIGDSYAGSRASHEGFGTSTLQGSGHNQRQSNSAARSRRGKDCDPKRGSAAVGQPYRAACSSRRRDHVSIPRSDYVVEGIKPKDLVGIPWMLAFALRADGWYLRQDIVWHKPNPMPESVTDRCTKAHEYVFLLSKSTKYYYNQDAILEPVSPRTHARLSQDVEKQIGSERANGGQKTNGNMKAVSRKLSEPGAGIKSNKSFSNAVCLMVDKRNKRSVWTVATEAFSEAHFATFPTELVKPCILAGCVPGGTVLDPFCGSGTTLWVARELACYGLGIELNPEYIEIAHRRLGQGSLLASAVRS